MMLTIGRRLALAILLFTYASELAAEVSRIEIARRETLSSEQTSVR